MLTSAFAKTSAFALESPVSFQDPGKYHNLKGLGFIQNHLLQRGKKAIPYVNGLFSSDTAPLLQ
jgi:hypothetical protein